MVQHRIFEIDVDCALKHVKEQPYYRGHLIVAEDARRQFLIISQSMSGIAAAIDEVCNQTVSETSLYESARRQLRRGRTGGCWSVVRLPRDDGIAHYNQSRTKYERRVVVAWNPLAWVWQSDCRASQKRVSDSDDNASAA